MIKVVLASYLLFLHISNFGSMNDLHRLIVALQARSVITERLRRGDAWNKTQITNRRFGWSNSWSSWWNGLDHLARRILPHYFFDPFIKRIDLGEYAVIAPIAAPVVIDCESGKNSPNVPNIIRLHKQPAAYVEFDGSLIKSVFHDSLH